MPRQTVTKIFRKKFADILRKIFEKYSNTDFSKFNDMAQIFLRVFGNSSRTSRKFADKKFCTFCQKLFFWSFPKGLMFLWESICVCPLGQSVILEDAHHLVSHLMILFPSAALRDSHQRHIALHSSIYLCTLRVSYLNSAFQYNFDVKYQQISVWLIVKSFFPF